MSDLERRLEELFMSDSRSRRVDRVNVARRTGTPLVAAGFIGAVALATVAAIFALNTMRPPQDQSAAVPSGSASPATSATATASGSAVPSSTSGVASVAPDARHGIITFENIRTEADPKDLQSPAQFSRAPGSGGFVVAVSPDGTRVAMITSGQTGQRLITFTTSRPNDVTSVLDFAGSGEFARGLVWAGDGSSSVLIAVEKQTLGQGGGDNLIVDYATLRSVDLSTRQVKELARISGQSRSLLPLAWLPARQVAAAVEQQPLGPIGDYILVRGGALERSALSGAINIFSFSASRDGTRIVGAFPPAIRWWPTEQPSAVTEITALNNSRAEFAAFRPGSDELGVNAGAPSAGPGVPPPGHFEIWSPDGKTQRVVSTTASFTYWRSDGSAAFDGGGQLIDPNTGATTPLPGGAVKIAATVMFSGSASASPTPPAATAPATTPPPAAAGGAPFSMTTINGRSYHLGTSSPNEPMLWRDFMPISEPGGRPMAAFIRVVAEDGQPFQSDIVVDHVWVHGPSVWEPTFEVQTAAQTGIAQNQIAIIASGGPKWDPGIEAYIVVRLRLGSSTHLLRVDDVEVRRVS
jgi:hypothetical protein